MTKNYALQKLLEHGQLDRPQIREITGWDFREVDNAIRCLDRRGKLSKLRKSIGRPDRFIYRLVNA